jgi:serine/threonine-protein kinase
LHDIADARIEIEDVLSGSPLIADTPIVDSQRGPARVPWMIAAIASLAALVAIGALAWNRRTGSKAQAAPPLVSRLTIGSSGAAALALTGARSLAITADGTRIVYVGNNDTQLFVRPIDRLEATAIFTSAAPLNWVLVSSDGQWVGFEEGSTLKKMAITGGPAMTIVQPPGGTRGAAWAPDDTIVYGIGDQSRGLHRVSAGGGEPTMLTQPTEARGERAHVWPEMLPGGRAVLFTIIATTGGLDAAQVAVLDLATRTVTVLVRGGRHAHYVSSGRGSPTHSERDVGHLLYKAGDALRAVPFDLARLATFGTPVEVLTRLAPTPTGASEFVVSADGTLAYVDAPEDRSAEMSTLVWVDRQGREEPLGVPAHNYFQPRVSPTESVWRWPLKARGTTSGRGISHAGSSVSSPSIRGLSSIRYGCRMAVG